MDINFDKSGGLVPAIVQDATTQKVLMLGYMNPDALEETRRSGKVTFFSRSKNRLWTKGESSGNFLFLEEIKVDCDRDTLLVKARPVGPVCHTGADTCFAEQNQANLSFLSHLQAIIHQRKEADGDDSYTASLFRKGINKIAQKVGEEAVEVVIEAKDQNQDLLLNESADLLFHLMVLLEAKGSSLQDVVEVLVARHGGR